MRRFSEISKSGGNYRSTCT